MLFFWLFLTLSGAGPNPQPPPSTGPVAPELAIGDPGPRAPRLGLGDLEGIALRHNPSLGQAAERIEQARGNVDQAGRYPNPFAVWNSQSIGAGGTIGEQGAFVQQPIVVGGKLRINRSRYEVDVELARWGLVEQRHRVINGVRIRYWQILAEQRLLEDRRQLVAVAEGVERLVREKVETGHASEADLLLAENVVEEMRLDLDQLWERYLNTWRELGAFLGTPGMPAAPLAGSLEPAEAGMDWDAALAHVNSGSPEIKIAELRVLRTDRDLRREQVEPIPDLILRGGAAHDPDDGETIGIARIYVDLPLWDRNQGNIYTARHAAVDSRKELDRIRLSVQQRLARRYNQYQTSLANVERYRGVILPRARKAFELYVDEFREEDEGYSRVQSSLGAYVDGIIKYTLQLQELRNAETAIIGYLLVEENIEAGTPRPPGGGLPRAPSGGGAPAGGRPTRGVN